MALHIIKQEINMSKELLSNMNILKMTNFLDYVQEL